MAKRQPVETMKVLLSKVIAERRLTAWCTAAGVRAQTIGDILDGKVERPHRGTITAIAGGLVVEKVLPANADPEANEARVRAACAASFAAANK